MSEMVSDALHKPVILIILFKYTHTIVTDRRLFKSLHINHAATGHHLKKNRKMTRGTKWKSADDTVILSPEYSFRPTDPDYRGLQSTISQTPTWLPCLHIQKHVGKKIEDQQLQR